MIIEDMDRSVGEGDPGKMLCVACEEAANSVCNGCKHAWYCSRDCQVADWPLHKKVCKDFAGAGSDDNRPSPEHRRILFFPVHSTKPETKWVVYNEAADDLFGLLGLKHPDLDLFETEVRKMGLRAEMSRIPLHLKPVLANRRVDHGLVVVTYTPNDPHHGAMEEPKLVNQSINGLTKPGYWRPLPGPVVLLADARRSGASGPPKIIDIIPRDLHTFARFFNSNECVCVTDVAHYRGEVISGLRINDLKNELIVAMGVKAMIDSVSVPLCASPGFTDYPIALAFHLGLRWYIRPGMLVGRQGSYTLWGDGNLRYLAYTVHIKETQVAEEKKREEPRATDEHEAMCKYGPFAGSVLILHGSGNPVDRYHVLAFNAYYDTTYIKKATPSKEGFQKFWAGYKKELGGPVSSVPSPYKWEKADIKDKLGLFDPDAVMKLVSGQFYNIWLAMMKHVNCFSTQTWTSQ
ncbi:hypothetical protein C8A03DRAFT_42707 [Achaetomium macrosporum]|uniref:MYND-type domain-containing protein n=1 Tax=Achaetomium macrosporum TaxID=79813 RepID=A0AAN7CEY3_9PEZI|nr:hypothetical protein C8A03DRAFT_42707 [Achaetomium macrosporum]